MNIEEFIKRYWYYGALLIIVLIALLYRAQILGNFLIPTWGNTMYHVGIEREMIETQHYPTTELSYGGGFPNFYVPGFRLLVASLSIATGIDVMVMSALIVPVLGVFGLLAVYAIAYRLSGGNKFVGLFAAFFFLLSPDITLNTVRPFPQLMGLFILPLALYFLLREDWPMAILMSVTMALTHQQSMFTMVGIMGLYMVFQFAYAAIKTKDFKKPAMVTICILALVMTYAIWQMLTMGTLNILNIAQITYHEAWPVTMSTIIQTGLFVLLFFIPGLVYIFLENDSKKAAAGQPPASAQAGRKARNNYNLNISVDAKLLILSWIAATVILFKNEMWGIWLSALTHISAFNLSTMQSRFYTYFTEVAIIIAAFGMYWLLSLINFDVMLEKQE
ncbi:hypothetical protein [Methanocella arvoryzae]|uniref:Glycosyltransferase RgtA/B/C/D-like domain-containing protein n=1 Tax=Methanocella arvoryzae (strain DSM 22066 / NBRC 105507 / MRE50) TaxID=351160 RepID=Q0W0G5_METAR|nr:hypothetical protein [Methanocella arvoryzae]CAJ38128.1 hypothetical protein RRC425 [Methanocella arvoryzae MRE50]